MKSSQRKDAMHVLRLGALDSKDPVKYFNARADALQRLGGKMARLLNELREVSASEDVLIAAFMLDHTMQHVRNIHPIQFKKEETPPRGWKMKKKMPVVALP